MKETEKRTVTVETKFRNEIIKETLRSQFTNSKNKISDEAVDLVGEIAKVITIEAAVRAFLEASSANKQTVTLEHVETILPQLMLDLP